MRLRFSRRPNAPATGRSPNVRWKPSFIWARRLWWGFPRQDPVGTLEANVRATWLLLEAARQCEADPGGFFRQGLRSVGTVTLPGALPAARQVSLQLLEKLRRPDRSNVCAGFRAARGHRALRKFFRRRRSELQPVDSRSDSGQPHNTPFLIRSDGGFVRRFSLRGRRPRRLPRLAEKMPADPSIAGEGSTSASSCGPPCSISPKKFLP
jgi:hypothetical protein